MRGRPAEQRLLERQRRATPLLNGLESWLRENMKMLSRHSELAKAFAYALIASRYTYYAEVDNIAENALRMASLGARTSCSSARITEVSEGCCCTTCWGHVA